MAEQKSVAVKVLVDSFTDGGMIYNAGAIVLNASDALIETAESGRKTRDGHLMVKKLSKTEALKAAKRADAGDEEVFFEEQVVEEEPEESE